MHVRLFWLTLFFLHGVVAAAAEEPVNVAKTFERIVADYQRIVASARSNVARAAAGRLTRDAYRKLIRDASGVKNLSADDLHALGQCHEAIGETDEARALYEKSLAAAPQARTELSLSRLSLQSDLKAAEQHFAQAQKLDPEYLDLPPFRLSLAAAHGRERNWQAAAVHLEHLLRHTKALAEQIPSSGRLRAGHAAVRKQLDQMRRFAGMTGEAAPPLKVRLWAQGQPVELNSLTGKVVLVDFCALWAQPSRERMELLKTLQQDGLEIVGVTQAYQHKYNSEADSVAFTKGLSLEDEASGLSAFAKKHGIPWRLAIAEQETIDQYGASALPLTVVINQQGNVHAILPGGEKSSQDLKTIVTTLLK